MEKWTKEETGLVDSYILTPGRFGDARGGYTTYQASKDFKELEINMKANEQGSGSDSIRGVIRGLHYQNDPYCQSKLVRCTKGRVIDVIVDIRKDSPTYKKGIGVELTPENRKELFVPRGFAHGFIALEDDTKFYYDVDNHYAPTHEAGITWNDPELDIKWVLDDDSIELDEKTTINDILKKFGIEEPLLSEKDINRKTLDEVKPDFYMHKRYLVTGCKGQLGYDVVRELNKRGIYDILNLDVEDMDITDRMFVRKVIEEYKPEYVIHCAAYTAVDKAEENEELARKINYNGTKNIADACEEVGAKMVYISTDYVFDGNPPKGYDSYDELMETNPLSVYGKTKREGELAALRNPNTFILRTAWVFGINGNNFVKTMLGLSEKYKELKVVNDQIGSPTYTVDLAKIICDMIETDKYGIYHVTNNGFCSWAEFASYILKDTDTKVIPVTTEEYYKPKYEEAKEKGITLHIAQRPLISKLNKAKLVREGFKMTPNWQDAVDRYMEELEQQKVLKK